MLILFCFCFVSDSNSFNFSRFVFLNMNIKDQLISLGWSIKPEYFEGNKQRIDDLKRQLLDVSVCLSHLHFYYISLS